MATDKQYLADKESLQALVAGMPYRDRADYEVVLLQHRHVLVGRFA